MIKPLTAALLSAGFLSLAVLATRAPAADTPGAPALPAAHPALPVHAGALLAAATPASAAVARAWAYTPAQKPAVPSVKQAAWVRTPLDAFVLSKLESRGLSPSPDADRATFIRRATLDAWGLIPTPEEVRAFVNDKSPKAYDKLVDRLLASPRYGERQGRRWLDLARYADSDGYNADGTRPNIWRYRDYVIASFNQDKPFDRFVREQIAGDELWPDRNEALVATGFLRNFPDEINARDLNLKKQEVANDLTDTVSSVFLGTTLGCAQCHDHKFDKISQKEYYQFQAFFVNASWNDDVKAVEGPARAEWLARQAKWEAATKDLRDQQDALLKPVIDKLESDRLSGFVPDTRASITRPEAERDAYDRWIYHRNLWTLSGRTRNALADLRKKDKDGYATYQALEEQLRAFDAIKPEDPGNISTMSELGHADSPKTYVLFKGIYDRRLDEVQPGFPSLLTNAKPEIVPTATSSGRRTAVANWLVSPDNPLTARVFVNRQWAQVFGNGIVESVSDFGKMGTKPTNPELLDYLSAEFVQDGWSVKKLQREILLSHTYRQSSSPRSDAEKIDPTNQLLWAFPRQRLEAEEIRDSLLQASGLLEDRLGGPAVFPPLPAGTQAPNRNFWITSDNPHDANRRSVYVFIRRNLPYPLLDTFDWANPQIVHNKRDVTTTAPQALALINSELVYGWSKALAGRVIREQPKAGDAARIDRVYEILYARKPDTFEKTRLLAFLKTQQDLEARQLASGRKVNLPEGYGVAPRLESQVDKLYKVAYGREPDRFEQAALVEFIEKQKQKETRWATAPNPNYDPVALAAAAAAANAAANAPPPDDGTGSEADALKNDPDAAHAAAFVDLVHALSNANDFLYRF
ncbi:MAG: DUF1553 domain-containing protein [Burkholderiales bacterium]|nr:DUF1553 domain-containing protein [Burkholderiales bacterium]